MKISKLPLTDFSLGKPVNDSTSTTLIHEIKTFSFFGEKPQEEEKIYTKTQFDAEIKQAQERSFEEGYKKGKSEMDSYISTEDIKIKEQLASILSRFLEGLVSFKKEQEEFKLETAKIATYAVKKIFADKVNEKIEEVIMDALSKSLEVIKKEPVIKFKSTPALMEKMKPTIEAFFSSNNLTAKINFEEIQNGNDSGAFIEWNNSGIKIDLNERMQEIDKILTEFIKSL